MQLEDQNGYRGREKSLEPVWQGPSAAAGLEVHLLAEAHQSDATFSHFILCHMTFTITCCIALRYCQQMAPLDIVKESNDESKIFVKSISYLSMYVKHYNNYNCNCRYVSIQLQGPI